MATAAPDQPPLSLSPRSRPRTRSCARCSKSGSGSSRRRGQQAATGDVLRVVAASPADVVTALEAIVSRAAALCEAPVALCYLREGDRLPARSR